MKITKVTYYCDYCGEVITEGNDVHTITRGRIGYDGQNILEKDPGMVRHYHDYCIEYLMLLKPIQRGKAPQKAEPEPEPEEEKVPKKNKGNSSDKKDLPALQAFINAGKTMKWCAEEFGVVPSTITVWKKEIEQMKEDGTWEAYCKERRI